MSKEHMEHEVQRLKMEHQAAQMESKRAITSLESQIKDVQQR